LTTRAEVVAYARETLGTAYQHQCRVAGVAMDCIGVPVHVALRLGMDAEVVADYGRQPRPDLMRNGLDKVLVRVPSSEMAPGDVVWIRFRDEPQHVAVVGDYVHGGLSLIHAYNGAGLRNVVEHRLDETWQRRIVGVWRFPGVTE
jgi:hypothetical protein